MDVDSKNNLTTLLDWDWFYNILELDLKNSWTNLLDSDLFYYNLARMLLEKYENLLELFVKQQVIQSSLESSNTIKLKGVILIKQRNLL